VGQTLDDPRVLPPLMDTSELPGARVLVVDDVADSGRTLALVMDLLAKQGAEARSAVLFTKPRSDHVPVVRRAARDGCAVDGRVSPQAPR